VRSSVTIAAVGPERAPASTTATRIGSYEILHQIARGGMAEIFLARQIGLERFEELVVLKKILPELAANEHFVRLFLDEARLSASLEHPNIAAVYDIGTVDGNYFFTMELVRGQDLRAILRRTAAADLRLPIEHAVQIGRHIASALHYAHEHRNPDGVVLEVVHRDVSPSNIVVSYSGTVKLLDFGVARAATRTIKTQTGALKGKISYMSPEQARGAALDRRSDLFSLGIVLWELVTTRRLFKADSDFDTLQQIVHDPIARPSATRADCPLELERIIMKTLAREKAERYQTAQELQLDLEELAREHKLGQSSVALGTYTRELFADEVKAWEEAETLVTASDPATPRARDELSKLLSLIEPPVGGGDFASGEHDSVAFAATALSPPRPMPKAAASDSTTAPVAPAAPSSRGPAIAAIAAIVLVAIGGVLFYVETRSRSDDAPPPAPSTAELELASTPPGAAIYVRGEPTGLVTPAKLAGLTPGQVAIRATLPGHAPASDVVTLRAGDHATRELVLVRIEGRLVVAGLPAGAELIVDGDTHRAGEVVPVLGGRHDVRVVANGKALVTQTVETGSGDEVWTLRGNALVRK
jgi:serine/threonine protein kinase